MILHLASVVSLTVLDREKQERLRPKARGCFRVLHRSTPGLVSTIARDMTLRKLMEEELERQVQERTQALQQEVA